MRCCTQAPEMSTVRGSLAAAVLDDKVYAIGGGRPGISLETTEIYDPTLDTFMAGTSLEPSKLKSDARATGSCFCASLRLPKAVVHWCCAAACRQAHGAQALHDSRGHSGWCDLRGGRL